MTAKRIGELLPQILERAATMLEFQAMLNGMEDDHQRRSAIMEAKMADEISDDDCHLLIEAYGLDAI
jgi:hypothetical protein